MKQIPIQLLNSLYIFSQSSNLKEASQRLGLSQPGLSKQFKALEDILPQSCFSVEGKKKVLTRYGAALVQEFEARFQGFSERLTQIASEHSSADLATIRIAGRREILDRFSDQISFPGRMIFSVLTNKETAGAIITGQVDFGITWVQPDSTEIIAKPLFTERYQIVVPKSLLKLTLQKKLPEEFNKLIKLPCVTYKEDDEVFRRFFGHYKMIAEGLTIRRTTANYQNLVRMIELGIGWSIVPVHYNVSKSRNWILPISESVGISRLFYLVYRKQLRKLNWAKAAAEEIQSCFKTII